MSDTKLKVIIIAGVLAFMAFLFSAPHFLPAPITVYLAEIIGAAAALKVGLSLWRRRAQIADSRQRLLLLVLLTPIFMAMAFAVASISVIDAAGYYTRMAGATAQHDKMVTGWYQRSRGVCAGPDFADMSTFADRPCLEDPVPNGTTLALTGRETSLGFEVSQIRTAP